MSRRSSVQSLPAFPVGALDTDTSKATVFIPSVGKLIVRKTIALDPIHRIGEETLFCYRVSDSEFSYASLGVIKGTRSYPEFGKFVDGTTYTESTNVGA